MNNNLTKKFIFFFTALILVISFLYFNISSENPGQIYNKSNVISNKYKLKWQYKNNDGISPPVIYKQSVIVCSDNGKIMSFQIETGKIDYQIQIDSIPIDAQPIILNDIMFAGNIDGDFYSIDLIEKKVNWKIKTKGKINAAANYFKNKKNDFLIIFGSYDNNVYCIESKSGKIKWKFETENYINGTPAVTEKNNFAVFGGCDNYLRALNINTGSEKYKINLKSYIPASPVISGNIVYSADYSGKLTAVDLSNGKILWQFLPQKNNSGFMLKPVVSENFILIGNENGELFKINKHTGKLILSKKIGRKLNVLFADKNHCFVSYFPGKIEILNLINLESVWSYETGIEIKESADMDLNYIAISDYDGTLFVFKKDAE